jgi:ketosteroid isomerase-like protein
MDDDAAAEVMRRFGRAYFSKDAAQLRGVITEDAEWHFAFGEDAPDGRVRRGIDGFMRGMAENDAMFERLRFGDVRCRALGGDDLVMTYLVDGQWRNGPAFQLRGVELIAVRGGRVARKDVFWKQFRRQS